MERELSERGHRLDALPKLPDDDQPPAGQAPDPVDDLMRAFFIRLAAANPHINASLAHQPIPGPSNYGRSNTNGNPPRISRAALASGYVLPNMYTKHIEFVLRSLVTRLFISEKHNYMRSSPRTSLRYLTLKNSRQEPSAGLPELARVVGGKRSEVPNSEVPPSDDFLPPSEFKAGFQPTFPDFAWVLAACKAIGFSLAKLNPSTETESPHSVSEDQPI